jgi:hypothetical protein
MRLYYKRLPTHGACRSANLGGLVPGTSHVQRMGIDGVIILDRTGLEISRWF